MNENASNAFMVMCVSLGILLIITVVSICTHLDNRDKVALKMVEAGASPVQVRMWQNGIHRQDVVALMKRLDIVEK